jgi:hypothetical protein
VGIATLLISPVLVGLLANFVVQVFTEQAINHRDAIVQNTRVLHETRTAAKATRSETGLNSFHSLTRDDANPPENTHRSQPQIFTMAQQPTLDELLKPHAFLRAALIVAGKRIRRTSRKNDPLLGLLRRELRDATQIAESFPRREAASLFS